MSCSVAIWSNSQEMLEMLWRVTKEYDDHYLQYTFLRLLLIEKQLKELHGEYDVNVLEKLGILGPNVLMVHCVYLTEEDMKLTKKYDMKVSHNTASNMYLSSGGCPSTRDAKKRNNSKFRC